MICTLVVEDDARVAAVHAAYVERVPGFAVAGVVHRGTEALEAVARGGVDLLLLDFYLPDMRGLELCRTLKARGVAGVDVIAVTAAQDADTVREAIGLGVVQYLIKPFAYATFADKLERYAAYRQRLRAAGGTATQHDVDALIGTLRGSSAPTLPKGLSQSTYDLVARALRDAAGSADEELSAVEVAASTGLSRVTARRYLEHMAADGVAALSLKYGTTGRPEHRYRWSG